MKHLKKLSFLVFPLVIVASVLILNLGADAAYALDPSAIFDPEHEGEDIHVVKTEDLRTNVLIIINYVSGFLGLISVAFIMYGGFLMVTSAGNEDKKKQATKILTYAVIGLFLVFLSYAIVAWVVGAVMKKEDIGVT